MSKYLTFDQRLEIEVYLRDNLSFGVIAKKLAKDRSTISKEVKRNRIIKKTGYNSWPYNACIHRKTCNKSNACEICKYPKKQYCKLCKLCNDGCPDFKEEVCLGKFKPPYVCNGCRQLRRCTLAKPYYSALDAHTIFIERVAEARSGIVSNEVEIARINALIAPLIRQGQSIHQIYVHHKDELMCSEKTLYNYVDACLFDVRNIDLPRKVKFRPRYKKTEFKVDRKCRHGRTYDEFKTFMEKYPEIPLVQMDSVIGTQGGKVLLTIHFVETSFMLAFLRDANTARSVTEIFDYLFKTLGEVDFEKLFPVILTDNGSEFSNPKAIEYGASGRLRSRVFYCDPSAPYQKGSLEVNYTLIRRVLPKKISFDRLTQADILIMMNHINSYSRKKLNDKSPTQAFSFYYGEEILSKLGFAPVAPDRINLTPKHLKK